MSEPALDKTAADKGAAKAKSAKGGAAQVLIDFGPVALFMLAYNLAHRATPDQAIYVATAIFMAATLVALGYAFFVQKRVPPMLIVTAVVVGVFGGLTMTLHDPVFIKMKPTVTNLLFAAAIFGGLIFKQNVWKILLDGSFDLPDRIWNILAIRYGFFFIFLAGLNEFIWRNFSEAFWANFKFLGVMTITLIFAAANVPIALKNMKTEEEPKG